MFSLKSEKKIITRLLNIKLLLKALHKRKGVRNCKTDYKGDPVKRTNILKISLSFERQQVGDSKDKGAFKEHSETLTPLSFVQGQQRFTQ